jgi:fatty-acyl-CoA synthase
MIMTSPVTFVDVLESLSGNQGFTFVDGDRRQTLSYGMVRERTAEIGRRLSARGLAKGDRIVLVLGDEREFVDLFFGAMRAGVVPVPVSPPYLLSRLDEYMRRLEQIVRRSGARTAVVDERMSPLFSGDVGGATVITHAEVMSSPGNGPLASVGPADAAFLQFSSGSTAESKGVVVTHGNLVANTRAIGEHLDTGKHDKAVSWLPMYHDMGLIGMVMVPLLYELPAWFLSPLSFARRPLQWLQLISDEHATITFAPNFAYSLVTRRVRDADLAGLDLSSWRIAGCGAEPIDARVVRDFTERFAAARFSPSALLPCYGLAEATLAVTFNPLGRGLATLSADRPTFEREHRFIPASSGDAVVELVSCGVPLPGVTVRIVDEVGRAVEDGMVGEVAVHGASVAAGYYADEASSATAFRNGWVLTGDLGVLVDGELYIAGRKKDLIIINGRNIHPQDVELCLAEEMGVRRGSAVAFSRPGEHGEELVAVVETAAGAPDDLPVRLRHRVRSRLGLVLADVVVLDKDRLPKTTSGKVRRQPTRQRYLAGELQPVQPAA